jgi:drug/metabolite transporter (DMT)-like permease
VAGVIALLGLDVAGEPDELLGAAAIMVAVVGYAIGPLVVKHRLADVEPLGPVAGSLGLASLMLLPGALLGAPSEVPSTQAIASVVVLGLACTAIVFLFYFALIAEVGPGRATVITYINPVIAVALGIVVLDESVSAAAVAGLLLILAGSWLSTDGRLPPGLAAIATGLRGRPAFLRRPRRAEELTARTLRPEPGACSARASRPAARPRGIPPPAPSS